MTTQFTATLYSGNQATLSQTSNDIKQLMVSLLDMIETTITPNAYGIIIDNHQNGKIIKTFTKNAPTNNLTLADYINLKHNAVSN